MMRNLFLVVVGIGAMVAVGVCQFAAAGDGCCDETHKVCVPHTEKIKVAKKCYSSICEDVCYPKCDLHNHKHGCSECGECGGCPDGKCGRPYKRKVLVVKFKTHEECVTKCKAEERCEEPCSSCSKHHRGGSCCPDACGSIIIMEGSGPAMMVPGAEPIAPPKDMK